MKRKFLLSAILALSMCMVFFVGCDKNTDVSKIIPAISTTTSITSTASEDTITINKVKQSFDNAGLENNIIESDSDTLYVGLPCDISITQKHATLFAGYSKEEQLAVRNQIKWDDFINSIRDSNDSVAKLTNGSKYKHIIIHAYSKTDSSLTFIIMKDDVVEKDIFETK